MNKEKIKETVKDGAGKAVEHAFKKVNIPYWAIYVVGIIVLGLIVTVIVYQLTLMSRNKLVRASQLRIKELELSVKEVEYQKKKAVFKYRVKKKKEDVDNVDKELKKIKKQKKDIQKSINRMTPLELRNAFRKEGFGFKIKPSSRPANE